MQTNSIIKVHLYLETLNKSQMLKDHSCSSVPNKHTTRIKIGCPKIRKFQKGNRFGRAYFLKRQPNPLQQLQERSLFHGHLLTELVRCFCPGLKMKIICSEKVMDSIVEKSFSMSLK